MDRVVASDRTVCIYSEGRLHETIKRLSSKKEDIWPYSNNYIRVRDPPAHAPIAYRNLPHATSSSPLLSYRKKHCILGYNRTSRRGKSQTCSRCSCRCVVTVGILRVPFREFNTFLYLAAANRFKIFII